WGTARARPVAAAGPRIEARTEAARDRRRAVVILASRSISPQAWRCEGGASKYLASDRGSLRHLYGDLSHPYASFPLRAEHGGRDGLGMARRRSGFWRAIRYRHLRSRMAGKKEPSSATIRRVPLPRDPVGHLSVGRDPPPFPAVGLIR